MLQNRHHRHPESRRCRDAVRAAAMMRAGEPLARARLELTLAGVPPIILNVIEY